VIVGDDMTVSVVDEARACAFLWHRTAEEIVDLGAAGDVNDRGLVRS